MSDNVDSLVLEHLRIIRGTPSGHGDRLGRIEQHLDLASSDA